MMIDAFLFHMWKDTVDRVTATLYLTGLVIVTNHLPEAPKRCNKYIIASWAVWESSCNF